MDPRVEAVVLAAMEAGLRTPLPPPTAAPAGAAFSDPLVHARELERVFRASWIPACRTAELDRAGAFATLDLAGDRLGVVRGRDGGLRALHNVCRHRGAQILRAERGCAEELRCPYHGFVYDLDGVLRTAPMQASLPPQLAPGVAALPPVAVEERLGFAFVHLGRSPPPLADALGKDLLDELSNWPLEQLESKAARTLRADFDWKIGVEAFLEPFHVPAIHARSAHPLIDLRGMALRSLGPHSRMALPFRAENAYAPEGVLGALARAAGVDPFPRLNRAQRTAHFVYLLFPSTVLMLLPTHVLTVSFLPEAPGRCALRYELLGMPARSAPEEAYFDGMVPGYERLLEEDLANLPWIQRGATDSSFAGSALSGYEARIPLFSAELARRLAP